MLWAEEENPHQMEVCSGTLGYMTPLVMMRQPCSYGADLWAFGVVLYEWLTERVWARFHLFPFESDMTFGNSDPCLTTIPGCLAELMTCPKNK
jgi:serine/threonine protein kinase